MAELGFLSRTTGPTIKFGGILSLILIPPKLKEASGFSSLKMILMNRMIAKSLAEAVFVTRNLTWTRSPLPCNACIPPVAITKRPGNKV